MPLKEEDGGEEGRRDWSDRANILVKQVMVTGLLPSLKSFVDFIVAKVSGKFKPVLVV